MTRVLCVIMTKFFEGGGLTTVMMNYYRALWSRSDYASEFHIDFLSHGTINDELRAEIESHKCRFYSMPGRKRNPIGHYKSFAKVIREGHYDVIHYNCNSGIDAIELAIAKRHIANRICHVHNAKPSYPLLHHMLKWLLNRSLTQAVATSDIAGRWLYGNASYIVLNNAIEAKRFAYNPNVRKAIREELKLADSTFVIGNVGRMNPGNQKNHGFLIQVFALFHERHPDSRLVIVGDGKLMPEWVALAKELNVEESVTFLGFQTNVSEILQAFDVFCFPSQWEGLGIAALEAQASGLPVLASAAVPREIAVTELVEFIDIEGKAESKWVDALEKHTKHATEPDRRNLGLEDQIRDNGFDINREVKRLVHLYLETPRKSKSI